MELLITGVSAICVALSIYSDVNMASSSSKLASVMENECAHLEENMDAKEYFENGVKKIKEETVEVIP